MWLRKAEPLLILFLPILKRFTALLTLFIFGILLPFEFSKSVIVAKFGFKKAKFTQKFANFLNFLLFSVFLREISAIYTNLGLIFLARCRFGICEILK